ncbi:MAG TPA: CUAEP/CCAEP-tail radical SAM protein [Methylomirabilota bacterium]|nr:CUAEP/CCAEP-tail radical SAM protein [Methylomirabilota bacterium]
MREPGDVLLVACYELGHQPLAVAWPAAFLERAGYRPALLDVSVEPVDAQKLARATVIAISVPMHTALRLGLGVAERARGLNAGAHVCFFGLYATLNAEYLFAHGADSVIGGEVETPLLALLDALERGDPGPLPAVSRPGRPAAPYLKRLNFPVPSRAGLPSIKKYAHVERDGRMELAAYAEASRGCLHRCRHCPIPPVYGGRFFAVPREIVLADVRQQIGAGARHVTFGDPDFLNGPTHALAIARALHAEWPDVTFDVTAKIEHLLRHRAHLPELARAGCLFIVSAAESLSDAVLANLDKGHTRADILTALAATREAGITLRPTWVAFTPWTTLDDHGAWLDFLASEALIDHVDPVQYGLRLLVPPGSLLLESAAMAPHLGPLEQETLSYRWTHPDPRMDRLQEETAQAVAQGVERNEDAPAIFDRVRALAAAAAGAEAPAPMAAGMAKGRKRPPRLTEAWFC